MGEQNRLNALEVALDNEMKERQFYLQNAERTINPLGRAVFIRLAEDELDHYERLKDIHQKLSKTGKWTETVPPVVKDTEIKTILESAIQEVRDMPKADDDDFSAIKTAIEFESKGVAFYEKLSDDSDEPDVKDFFKLLAGIEREHLLALRKAETFFTDPESYFASLERSSLDGA